MSQAEPEKAPALVSQVKGSVSNMDLLHKRASPCLANHDLKYKAKWEAGSNHGDLSEEETTGEVHVTKVEELEKRNSK